MNAIVEVSKILLQWSIKKQDWYITVLLHHQLNIGLPNKFIYYFPQKNAFNLNSVLNNQNEIILTNRNNKFLNKLLTSFKYSKWCMLEEWGNLYGYRCKF